MIVGGYHTLLFLLLLVLVAVAISVKPRNTPPVYVVPTVDDDILAPVVSHIPRRIRSVPSPPPGPIYSMPPPLLPATEYTVYPPPPPPTPTVYPSSHKPNAPPPFTRRIKKNDALLRHLRQMPCGQM